MQIIDFKKEFGAAVKHRRKSLGLSQETLAERANLHRTYVTDVERGTRNVTLESISKLARGLGVEMESLFASPAAPAEQTFRLRGVKGVVDILLVEDDAKDAELTLAAFKEAKLTNRVVVVKDGIAALDYLFCAGEYRRRQPENLPEVVLLDLNLPKMGGLEVLNRIKSDVRTRHTKVVVLSGSQRNDHITEAMRLGAEAYLIKPVDFQRFSQVTPVLDFHWKLFKPDLNSECGTLSKRARL
jgi:CheY-like chemotaxis protein/DNA-binding XRE family transcriptional regulator